MSANPKPPQRKPSKPKDTFATVKRTPTLLWTKPICSYCRQHIQRNSHGYVGWYEDEDGRTYSPVVTHSGAHCPYFAERIAPREMRAQALDSLRCSPMEAVMIALRHRGDTEEERLTWATWISVVLGLPFGRGKSALDLWSHDEVADFVPAVVPGDCPTTQRV